MEMSQYAQALFVNVLKSYAVDSDIEVKYTITSQLQPTTSDWLGIFKIGWCSAAPDAIHRVGVLLPEKYEAGQPANATAIFEGISLPKDTDEFYQFCYINSKGQVRGASTPFQFRKPKLTEEEFIEEDYEDMLVVTTKSAVLDEKLDLATEKIQLLSEEKLELVKDRQNLMLELSKTKKNLEECSASVLRLTADLEAYQQTEADLRQELVSAKDQCEASSCKTELLMKENEELACSLRKKDADLMQLQERLEHHACIETERVSSLAEAKSQREALERINADLRASFNKVTVELAREKQRFMELERTLACSQAEVQEQCKVRERSLRDRLDAAVAEQSAYVAEASDLKAKLEEVKKKAECLKLAVASSETRIMELCHQNAAMEEKNASLTEVIGHLEAELKAVRAEVASNDARSRALCENSEKVSGDSYHALVMACKDLKEMLKERSQERDSLKRSEKVARGAAAQLSRENQSLVRQRLALEEECCGLREEMQQLTKASIKGGAQVQTPQAATYATGGLCPPKQGTLTAKELRDRLAAADDYYRTTLRHREKDLAHEQETRHEAERLLHESERLLNAAVKRCVCKEAAALLRTRPERPTDSTGAEGKIVSTGTAPFVTNRAKAASAPDHFSWDEVDLCMIREPPLLSPIIAGDAQFAGSPAAPESQPRPFERHIAVHNIISDPPLAAGQGVTVGLPERRNPSAELWSGYKKPSQPQHKLPLPWARPVPDPWNPVVATAFATSQLSFDQCCVCSMHFDHKMTVDKRNEHINKHFP